MLTFHAQTISGQAVRRTSRHESKQAISSAHRTPIASREASREGGETSRQAEKQSGRRITEQAAAAGMHNIDQGTFYAA